MSTVEDGSLAPERPKRALATQLRQLLLLRLDLPVHRKGLPRIRLSFPGPTPQNALRNIRITGRLRNGNTALPDRLIASTLNSWLNTQRIILASNLMENLNSVSTKPAAAQQDFLCLCHSFGKGLYYGFGRRSGKSDVMTSEFPTEVCRRGLHWSTGDCLVEGVGFEPT